MEIYTYRISNLKRLDSSWTEDIENSIFMVAWTGDDNGKWKRLIFIYSFSKIWLAEEIVIKMKT